MLTKQQENQPQQHQDRPDEELVLIDDQVQIGASNYRIALEKSQPDVIYKVFLAILKQYSIFNAFIRTDDKIFEVNAELLCEALQITPKDSDHPFLEPPSEKAILSSSTSLLSCLVTKSKPLMIIQNIWQSLREKTVKGRGKGLLSKKGVEVTVERVSIPKKRSSKIVIEEIGQSEEVADAVDSEETEEE
ncbi:hypothetical protein Tco_0008542 [Tanacetum coccineum]